MARKKAAVLQTKTPISFFGARIILAFLFLATALTWLLSRALLAANFLPHWYCYAGNARLVWSNVITDFGIALSYTAISGTLVWLVRHAGRDLPYRGFFRAFGLFIVSCGITHLMEVVTIWQPVYWLSTAVKIVTALASVGTAVVLYIAKDDILGFVRTAREIAAMQSGERFRALIEAAPMAVLGFDRAGRINVWNPSAEEIFELKAADVIGKPNPTVPPEMWAQHEELLHKSLAGEVTTGFETTRMKADGTRIPVSASAAPVYDEQGEMTGIMAVIEDISERKSIEGELQEKTEVLTTVTTALNTYLESGDWKKASHGLLKFAIRQTRSEFGFLGVVLNGAVLRILAHDGFSWDASINREFYENAAIRYEKDGFVEFSNLQNLFGQAILKGVTVISNHPKQDARSGGLPAGHPELRAFLAVPIFKGAEVAGLIAVANREGGYSENEVYALETMSQATGVLYDSYRQNVKRASLEKQQERLEAQMRQAQKMEVLGRLAGGVAHDFNNMLMVLGGSSELLERALPKDGPARAYVEQIQRTTEKAAAITRQLLAFSRKQLLEFRPIDLHEALTESEFMLPRLLGSDIELTFRHEAARSWIRSDPSQIEQVVANLAINARDAMPNGGRLMISTRNEQTVPEQTDSNSPVEKREWIVLEVADTGHGMDAATKAQIFEPFFTTKPEGKGTGLGLATVYGIIKQCLGHIRVESEPGQGAQFKLYFPVIDAPEAPKKIEAVHNSEDTDGEGATILVADDEAGLRQAVVEILRSSGYSVFEAQSGKEALKIAQNHAGRLDLLLTDVVMPGLRGPELARTVLELHPETKVVYMSGYAEGFSDQGFPAKAAYLQKPFRFATLLEQLKLVRHRN